MRSDEWASNHEAQVIKGQSGKSGQGAGKGSVLIWGDLLSDQNNGNSPRKRGLRWQGSAEAIVCAGQRIDQEG